MKKLSILFISFSLSCATIPQQIETNKKIDELNKNIKIIIDTEVRRTCPIVYCGKLFKFPHLTKLECNIILAALQDTTEVIECVNDNTKHLPAI